MKDEIKNTFEGLTEPVHPGFRTQLRSRLDAGRPVQRAPFSRLVPALAAALLVAAVVVSALLLGGRPTASTVPSAPAPATPSPVASPTAQPSPSPASSPTPSAVPSPSPTAPALPPFQCSAQGGGLTPTMPVTPLDVRIGAQPGYDRFVIETNAVTPTWSVTPQSSTTFTEDASGRQFTLAGTHGILVRLHGAGPQSNGTWAQDVKGNAVIREARQMGNFEAVFTWGLGVDGTGCFRAFTLTGPDRLVVDVQVP